MSVRLFACAFGSALALAAVVPAASAPRGLGCTVCAQRASTATFVISGRGWGHGVGMSQYGALGKARRGLSADDILAAYYGGIRPETLGEDQLPDSIRVELQGGLGSVGVSAEHYFRVVSVPAPDSEGAPSGALEMGTWRVQPAAGGVRVIPPEGREPFSVRTATVEPPASDGQPATVRYDLNGPAVVTVRYVTPLGEAGTVPSKLVGAGEVVETLPPPGSGGEYQVVIEADAGSGRSVSVPLSFVVAGDIRIHIGALGIEAAPSEPDRSPWLALAAILLLASAAATYRNWLLRRRKVGGGGGGTTAGEVSAA